MRVWRFWLVRAVLPLFAAFVAGGCVVSQCRGPEDSGCLDVKDGLPARLEEHVRFLSEDCHPRSVGFPANQEKALRYIERELAGCGGEVRRLPFKVGERTYENVQAVFPGRRAERAMVCLEMIGFFSDEPDSQSYPAPGMGMLFPDRGNFVAVVGNWGSVGLARGGSASWRSFCRRCV